MSNSILVSQQRREAFDCPVVVFVFNRPELTRNLIKQLARVRPTKLYVVSDGPRKKISGDRTLVSETRDLFTHLDWQCELVTLFRDNNLGCRQSISRGLDWVFSYEERAIILEDDCFPDLSFFEFADELLRAHSSNLEIGCICGSNLDGDLGFNDGNQVRLSRFPAVWGWATWRRTWSQISIDISNFSYREIYSLVTKNVQTTSARLYFLSKFILIKRNALDTWDYQMTLKFWELQLKAIIPRRNMISNLGFGNLATNTIWSKGEYIGKPISDATEWVSARISTLPPFEQSADKEAEMQRLNISVVRFCLEVAFAISPSWMRNGAVWMLRKVRTKAKSQHQKRGQS